MPVPDLTAVDAALEHGECERALELLAELYEQDQQVPEVNSRIADALFALQRHDEAEGMYTWLAENHRDSLARRRARECRERIASTSESPESFESSGSDLSTGWTIVIGLAIAADLATLLVQGVSVWFILFTAGVIAALVWPLDEPEDESRRRPYGWRRRRRRQLGVDSRAGG